MATTQAAQATPDADADERAPYAQLFDAHWHSTEVPDESSGRQCITVQLDLTGQQITLALDMASVRLLHTTTAPDYFRVVLGDAVHPTRSAPLCKDCQHVVINKGDRGGPYCGAAQAPRCVVTGSNAPAPAMLMREQNKAVTRCGEEGRWFQPARSSSPCSVTAPDSSVSPSLS